ncbi:threonine synthase [Leeia aquatica]|uniref:Threonine synthase n=1 Tax=Leeia aquatica TaxID=2725557 RepID=A0A847SFK5_9NEIS|nr:threonine synthase [Leeia aquatica]NLR76039.1 threonine synthase [Leeia aquatica]
MRYVSTRGEMAPREFSDILLSGLAPDGGLAMCEQYPQVTDAELSAWRSYSYAELAMAIIRKFATDIPEADLRAMIERTYTAEVFGSADITPLKTLAPELHVLGLSNGPTLAFKDMAMQLLGNLFEYALAKRGASLNILGATSGDTGSAAEHAMRGKAGIRVFMLSPHGKMSPFQTAQMFGLQDPNIFNIAIEGVFDDCQDIVKAVSNDHAYKEAHQIGTVNSINWGRIVAQVVYYFRGYLMATSENQQKVSFAVPSGNFGNICAGHIARQMGLPIDKLVLATNENDVLDEFFRTGIYRVRKSAETQQTSSPSMDISKASNFERFIFDLTGRDGAATAALFRKVDREGGFDLRDTPYWSKVACYGFVSGRSSHADRVQTIREVWSRYGMEVDTHTADGLFVAQQYREAGVPMICLETALPAKFEATMVEALGRRPARPQAYEGLEALPQRFEVMAADAEAVKAYIHQHTR